MKPSILHASLSAGQCRPLVVKAEDTADVYRDMHLLGIQIAPGMLNRMVQAMYAMDDTVGLQTTAGIPTGIQFLQTWLPGFVRTMTQARKIDELIGIDTVGAWEDEEIIQGVLEPAGLAVPYGDSTNIPLASWNPAFERRTVLRFEMGFEVGTLEEARTARMKVNTAAEKRASAALSLDIQRNRIGFFGYNGGNNRTYGFLNDPSLPAYVTVPNGAAGTSTWATKTYLEVIADIRSMVQGLRTNMGDNIDPEKDAFTLVVASAVAESFGLVSTYGVSVREWMRTTYPGMVVKTAPELNGANGGANVAYMYPERVEDGSSDGGRVWAQLVPAKFRTIGVAKGAKAYVEDFSNAVAGVMLKRPYAVRRITGI